MNPSKGSPRTVGGKTVVDGASAVDVVAAGTVVAAGRTAVVDGHSVVVVAAVAPGVRRRCRLGGRPGRRLDAGRRGDRKDSPDVASSATAASRRPMPRP